MNVTKKGRETVKYETAELTALTPAINAIQSTGSKSCLFAYLEGASCSNEAAATYADWE